MEVKSEKEKKAGRNIRMEISKKNMEILKIAQLHSNLIISPGSEVII